MQDEKEIERVALLKRQGEDAKARLLQRLPLLVRDDEFFPLGQTAGCCRPMLRRCRGAHGRGHTATGTQLGGGDTAGGATQ